MNVKNLRVGMIATTLLALGTLASPAFADGRQDHRSEWRQDTREIHQDRRELAKDRADYQRAQAHGNTAAMFRERKEIRHDQAELRHDLRDRRQDVRGHQSQGHQWGEQRVVRHDFRPDAAHGHQVQAVNRQGPRQQPASSAAASQPATAQQNNGRHLGWEQGSGNPHRG